MDLLIQINRLRLKPLKYRLIYMKNFTCTLLIFVSLYPFALNLIPSISTRILLSGLGIGLFFLKLTNNLYKNGKLTAHKSLIHIIVLLITISLISIISNTYNHTLDLEFIRYCISVIIGLFNAYFVVSIFKLFKSLNERFLVKLIIISVAIQSIISFMLFLKPEFQSLLYSFIYLEELKSQKVADLSESRIIGFGRSFFAAGIHSGMALMLIVYSIRYFQLESKRKLLLIFLYALIFSIGMMMARTTLVGAVLSLVMLLYPNNANPLSLSKARLKFFSLLLIIPTIIVISITILSPRLLESINTLIEFAFEFFLNFRESGELKTSSTDRLLEMYAFPDNLKTWLIGDGLWWERIGWIYYMHTDVGYLRMIYYFGIFGLIAFFMLQYLILINSLSHRLPILLFFLYLLALNLKGFADLVSIFSLFYVLNYYRRRSHQSSV